MWAERWREELEWRVGCYLGWAGDTAGGILKRRDAKDAEKEREWGFIGEMFGNCSSG
jgi:hypothetical protein